MAGAVWHKVAFYASVTALNMGAVGAIGLAYVLPAFEARQVAAATPPVIQKPTPAPVGPTVKSGIPVRVVVPARGVDLPVERGNYDTATGSWTLSDTTALYATPTVPVNNKGGTTLIYGHNTWPVFQRLHQLQPGDELIVYANNGFVFRYKFTGVQQVTPDNVTLLSKDGSPAVLLQTCSGVWSQYRKLFSFELISVETNG